MNYNQYWDRIAQLLTNSPKNISSPPSNCLGTVLYVLNAYDSNKPRYADNNEMKEFLENCVEEKDYLSIVIFYNPNELIEHAGICIDIERNIMFHQPDTGMNYEFKFISEYISETSENSFLNGPKFYVSK